MEVQAYRAFQLFRKGRWVNDQSVANGAPVRPIDGVSRMDDLRCYYEVVDQSSYIDQESSEKWATELWIGIVKSRRKGFIMCSSCGCGDRGESPRNARKPSLSVGVELSVVASQSSCNNNDFKDDESFEVAIEFDILTWAWQSRACADPDRLLCCCCCCLDLTHDDGRIRILPLPSE
jgi:hypothetical protein